MKDIYFRRKRDDLSEKITFHQSGGLARKDDRIQSGNRLVLFLF